MKRNLSKRSNFWRKVELCQKYIKNTKRLLTWNNSDVILNFVAAKDTWMWKTSGSKKIKNVVDTVIQKWYSNKVVANECATQTIDLWQINSNATLKILKIKIFEHEVLEGMWMMDESLLADIQTQTFKNTSVFENRTWTSEFTHES